MTDTITATEAQAILRDMIPLRDVPVDDIGMLHYRNRLVAIVEASVADQKYVTLRNSLIDKAYDRAHDIVGNKGSSRQKDLTFLAEMDHLYRREVAEGRFNA